MQMPDPKKLKLFLSQPDPNFLTLLVTMGPLVSFEGLLSLHGEDVTIFNDMIVAVEDLRNVEFTLILVDKRSKVKLRNKSSNANSISNNNGSDKNGSDKNGSDKKESSVNILEYHSFPLPRVTGSRSSLKGENFMSHKLQ
jgi:hypothetical protein